MRRLAHQFRVIFSPWWRNTLDSIIILLSWIIPKNSKILLFTSHHGDRFKGNPKYIFLYLIKQSTSFNPYWVTNSSQTYDQLKSHNLPVVRTGTIYHFWTVLRAKWIIIDNSLKGVLLYDGRFIFLSRLNIIQTWHGTPFKNIHPFSERPEHKITKKFLRKLKILNHKKYRLIVASSANDKRRKEQAFDSKRVVVLGEARNDIFSDHGLLWDDLTSIIEPFKTKKIILYAPTFRDYGEFQPFTDSEFAFLDKTLGKLGCVFLIKRHPSDKSNFLSQNECVNIFDITDQIGDIQELLLFTSLLVSDYSSVVADFVNTNRPVAFYYPDHQLYTLNRNMYYDVFELFPGPFCFSVTELIQTIEQSICQGHPDNIDSYASFRDNFNLVKPGSACRNLLSFIENN